MAIALKESIGAQEETTVCRYWAAGALVIAYLFPLISYKLKHADGFEEDIKMTSCDTLSFS